MVDLYDAVANDAQHLTFKLVFSGSPRLNYVKNTSLQRLNLAHSLKSLISRLPGQGKQSSFQSSTSHIIFLNSSTSSLAA